MKARGPDGIIDVRIQEPVPMSSEDGESKGGIEEKNDEDPIEMDTNGGNIIGIGPKQLFCSVSEHSVSVCRTMRTLSERSALKQHSSPSRHTS